jgi:shikimate kinase
LSSDVPRRRARAAQCSRFDAERHSPYINEETKGFAVVTPDQNIVLIGMPSSGKSTVGVLLAKEASRRFADTDVLIQAMAGKRLQAIIEEKGLDAFNQIEESVAIDLDCRGYVIATGGSVVYSERAMEHLSRGGVVVYLYLPFPRLKERAPDLDNRGLVRKPGQSLRDLYQERTPLYERYADVTIDCTGLDHEGVLQAIRDALDL